MSPADVVLIPLPQMGGGTPSCDRPCCSQTCRSGSASGWFASTNISMVRDNADGTQTPLTMPNHRRIKGSTLRTICTQANIPRNEFLQAYKEA
ncbi:MAG TPA: hypothetical protein VKI65_15795 [Gemmataceae bacterium]|nr:hypothetical protein [Gemmataceae bacterium]